VFKNKNVRQTQNKN